MHGKCSCIRSARLSSLLKGDQIEEVAGRALPSCGSALTSLADRAEGAAE